MSKTKPWSLLLEGQQCEGRINIDSRVCTRVTQKEKNVNIVSKRKKLGLLVVKRENMVVAESELKSEQGANKG